MRPLLFGKRLEKPEKGHGPYFEITKQELFPNKQKCKEIRRKGDCDKEGPGERQGNSKLRGSSQTSQSSKFSGSCCLFSSSFYSSHICLVVIWMLNFFLPAAIHNLLRKREQMFCLKSFLSAFSLRKPTRLRDYCHHSYMD